MKTMMVAFHGDNAVKQKYLTRVAAHEAADEIVQGKYWEGGKGCAVGCTIHGNQHGRYETEMGIPRSIAYLQDRIFEMLANAGAKKFPRQFIEAVPVGADLSMVAARFIVWLLDDPEHGVVKYAKGAGLASVKQVAALYRRKIDGDEPTKDEWAAAWRSAEAAAWRSAEAAAWRSAAEAAAEAAAAEAAAAAAEAAAWRSAAAAAAAEAAAAAAEAAAAYSKAKTAAAEQQRYKLLELLQSAPVVEVV